MRRRPSIHRPARVLAVVSLLGVLTACGAAGAQSDPTWVPAQTPSAIPLPTQVPDDSAGSGSGGSTAPNSNAPPSATPTAPAIDPNVVATKLSAPHGLAVLPDGTALVAERSTGRILLVQPVAGQPVKLVKTLGGLDTSDGGGVLDIALSATYGEDGLVLALITTPTDIRLVHFTLSGVVTPILTGIPRGSSDSAGTLLVLDNGDILVGTGDAGSPTLALDAKSLAGKVLRVDDLGKPAEGNPVAGSRVYTSGHRTVDGLCVDTDTSSLYATQAAVPGGTDSLLRLVAGRTYGAAPTGPTAIALPGTIGGAGGCAVVDGALYVTGLGGKDVFRAALNTNGTLGTFTGLLTKKYGRISNVVGAPDGSIWLTTSNRDGQGTPIATDERVLHIHPAGGGGSSDA